MEREAEHLQALIDDLFTLARAEVRQLELRCAVENIGLIAARAVSTFAPLAWSAQRIDVTAELAGDGHFASVDTARLEQILFNLLHNAVRHTAPGGLVAVVVDREAELVALRVRDTGEGIDPADLPHIWGRFYRAESARARGDGGTGLGLALVKELTEAMGGTVSVASVVGEGTVFTLLFPAVPASAPAEPPLRIAGA